MTVLHCGQYVLSNSCKRNKSSDQSAHGSSMLCCSIHQNRKSKTRTRDLKKYERYSHDQNNEGPATLTLCYTEIPLNRQVQA